MKRKRMGLSDMIPRRYAVGGAVKAATENDDIGTIGKTTAFNSGATFTGSPAGTGLTSKVGNFTTASADAVTPKSGATFNFGTPINAGTTPGTTPPATTPPATTPPVTTAPNPVTNAPIVGGSEALPYGGYGNRAAQRQAWFSEGGTNGQNALNPFWNGVTATPPGGGDGPGTTTPTVTTPVPAPTPTVPIIKPTAPVGGGDGTSTTTPAVTTPPVTTPASTTPAVAGDAAPGLSTLANNAIAAPVKAAPIAAGDAATGGGDDVFTQGVTAPVNGNFTLSGLDTADDKTKYVLPTGEAVGAGGKLGYDVGALVKKELGRNATAQELLDYGKRVNSGIGLADIGKELDSSAAGQEYNLFSGKLNDDQFVIRAFRMLRGRDPTPQEQAIFGTKLQGGYTRQKLIDDLTPWAKENLKDYNEEGITRSVGELMGQGDAFDGKLKGDETETIVKQQFKGIMGRDPTDYELAKYADAVRRGVLTLGPEGNTIMASLNTRKTEGWKDGGRVTARDRYIETGLEDKTEGKKHEQEEPPKVEAKEDAQERAPLDAADRALLEKYRRKSLGERITSGLSSLIR